MEFDIVVLDVCDGVEVLDNVIEAVTDGVKEALAPIDGEIVFEALLEGVIEEVAEFEGVCVPVELIVFV